MLLIVVVVCKEMKSGVKTRGSTVNKDKYAQIYVIHADIHTYIQT